MARISKFAVAKGVEKLKAICVDIPNVTCTRRGNKIYWMDGEQPVAILAVTPRCLKLTDVRLRLAWEMKFT